MFDNSLCHRVIIVKLKFLNYLPLVLNLLTFSLNANGSFIPTNRLYHYTSLFHSFLSNIYQRAFICINKPEKKSSSFCCNGSERETGTLCSKQSNFCDSNIFETTEICSGHGITKTCLYNFDPLKPHFYIVTLGFTGVYIIFLIFARKHRLWVLVWRCGSNEYQQSMF